MSQRVRIRLSAPLLSSPPRTRRSLETTGNELESRLRRLFPAQVFLDERLTTALLDRLTHRANSVEFTSESYRFRQRLQRQGKKQAA